MVGENLILIEALWVSVIQRLRHLNTSLGDIGHIKPNFFEIIDWECPISLAEYYALCAVFLEKPLFLLSPLCSVIFSSIKSCRQHLATARFESCIIVHLNPILNKLFPKKESNPDFHLKAGLHVSSKKFSRFLQMKTSTRSPLEKRKESSTDAILKRDLLPTVSEHLLKQGHKNLAITTNIVDGRTTSRTRTIKKHLKGSTQ